MPKRLRRDEMDAIEALIRQDGVLLAGTALERARGSEDVAIAILGVAADTVLQRLEPEARRDLAQRFLDSFDRSDA